MNRLRLLIPLLTLLCLGCRTMPGQPMVTSTIPIETSPSASSTPTDPPPTSNSTSTLVLPTPDFLTAPVDVGSLLASATDNCRLPCWQGLRIGESTGADVQRVFDDAYGFHGTLDFLNNTQITDNARVSSSIQLLFPELLTTGFEWFIDQEDPGPLASKYKFYYAVFMVLDKNVDSLKGMLFVRVPGTVFSADASSQVIEPGYFQVHTPQQLIQAYGTPDWIYNDSTSAIILIYSEGHISEFVLPYRDNQRIIEGASETYGEFCLDDQPVLVIDYLVDPFDSLITTEDFGPQNIWLESIVEHRFYGPVEDKLGYSVEEITALALQTAQRPCILIPYD